MLSLFNLIIYSIHQVEEPLKLIYISFCFFFIEITKNTDKTLLALNPLKKMYQIPTA